MIRVFLNGVQTSNVPFGIDSLSESLVLSDEVYGYVYQISGTITLQGDDYDTIRALYESEYCQDVTIEIQYSEDGNIWEMKAEGIIKLVSVTWDLVRRQAECPITDNSFLSRINNNRNIKFTLGTPLFTDEPVLSKNGVDVTYKWVYHDNVQMFSPLWKRYFEDEAEFTDADSADIDLRPQGRKGIFIYDALNLIIAMMTDDEVEFESTYFTYSLATPNSYFGEAFTVLMAGSQIRAGIGAPEISFDELFGDLHRLFNVWFSLEVNTQGKPVIRIEHEDYFRGLDSSQYFNSVESLSENIDLSLLYARIVLGCSEKDKAFPIKDIPLILHSQEEYGLTGICNTDNTLDLRLRSLIINTNSIARVLPPISGFNVGESVIKKYSTESTTAGVAGRYQIIEDSDADFEVKGIDKRYILHETLYDLWTYVADVQSNIGILINDEVFVVDDPSTGIAKNYQIYSPALFDEYDDRVFLVQGDRNTSDETTFYALGTTITLPDVYYYNVDLANYKVIERHLGGLAQDIINQISDGNDEFNSGVIATFASFTTIPDPMYRVIIFDDDSTGPTYFDTNGNYDNTTGFYHVPQAGYYHAECQVNIRNESSLNDTLIYQVELAQLTATNEIVRSVGDFQTITYLANATFTLDGTFACDEGDKLCVIVKRGREVAPSSQYVSWANTGALIRQPGYSPAPPVTSTFGVDALFNGGGVLTPSDPTEVRVVEVNSELSCSRDEFDSVIQNPLKYYHIYNMSNGYKTGFIREVARDILSGKTNITLFKKHSGV